MLFNRPKYARPIEGLGTRVDPPCRPRRDVEHVELATMEWVDWFNTERLHESIDDLTPIQAEEVHYAAETVAAG